MSEKELLYVEDGLSQAKHMRQKCDKYGDAMQDRELKAYLKELGSRFNDVFNQVYKLLQ